MMNKINVYYATQKILRFSIITVTVLFSTLFLIIAYFGFGFHSQKRSIEPRFAFWMEHAWANSSFEDFQALRENLKRVPSSDLYFHVGPIQADGSLASDLHFQRQTLLDLGTTNYAWIGQIRSEIDLDDPAIREKIIASSTEVLKQGFDGIHVDIEPVREDDQAFFLLMEDLRAALPDAKISVAMDEWQPHFISQTVAALFNVKIESYWSKKQVLQLLPSIDQLVVMTYDTVFHDPALFTWWVEQQTIALSNLMPEGKELFIGIPAYEEGVDPNAENLITGYAGYERGARNWRSHAERVQGVAVYPYWELSEAEWILLETLTP